MNTLTRIQDTARKRGMSLEKLAEEVTKSGVKVAKSTIYRWDTSKPNAIKLKAVADVLGVSVDYLLGNVDTPALNKVSPDEPLNLYEVSDDERDEVLSINGQPISDDDWAIMKVIMAKYPKKGQ